VVRETAERVNIPRLILVPAAITPAATLLRPSGELRHWPTQWFNNSAGGVTPRGVFRVGFTATPGSLSGSIAREPARRGHAPQAAPSIS
jgi:hypothetical protein